MESTSRDQATTNETENTTSKWSRGTNDATAERVIPVSLVQMITDQLRSEAIILEKWNLEEARMLKKFIDLLQQITDNPLYVWVSTAEAARRMKRSEETIRRYCRTGTAPFKYRLADNNRYEIWLPDLPFEEEEQHVS